MKLAVKQVYTSVACNRVPEIVDWNNEGLICFGAFNSVVIYDTNVKGKDPLTVHSHHRSTVNSVKWVRKHDGTSTELVSCSADKTGAIWTLDNGEYKVTNDLAAHSEPVTCVYGIYMTGDDLVVYTGSIDSTVNIWERSDGVTTLKQKLNLNSGLCLTLHAHLLPVVKKPILLCALDDHKIHVFAENSNREYHRVHILVGHDDWVRGLDVLDVDDNAILLASCSQDTYIRVWRISLHHPQPTSGIQVEQTVFEAHSTLWAVTLEAVLAAHDGWVYGVQWHPYKREPNKKPVYRLLSSSLDRSIIVWEPEGEAQGAGEGAWVERVRVGEVGGNGLGFYGCRLGPRGDAILGHGYNGSFHIWHLDKETNQWSPSVVIGGHFGAVEDIQWEPSSGRYLVSVSADQTTRLHAPWIRTDFGPEWHEVSRPQVHGFDMSSLALISGTLFASAAEEKVIRVFRAPHNFVHNFGNITGEILEEESGAPEGATVPSLGLSNKAVFGGGGGEEGDDTELDLEDDSDGYFVPVNLTEPPTEETLIQNTLWPEVHKLYGHGYEVFALSASGDGALLASACKASTAEHAAVLLWETKTWSQIQKLTSHSLTVTQLAFSPDSQHLLSVSRDRRWTLYERQPESLLFTKAAITDKSNGVHTRIIWCCAWAHDNAMFATGSREGKICVWSKSDMESDTSLGKYGLLGKPMDVPGVSITALAFAPIVRDGARVVAAGFDVGVIRLYSFDGCEWSLLKEISKSGAHHMTVKRLAFKPGHTGDGEEMLLASCGADHFVRIHGLTFR